MKAFRIHETKFEDLVGTVEFRPLNLPDNKFSGFYLPIVNNKPLFPVSDDFRVIKTQDVVDIVKESVNIPVKFEKTLDFGTYHKHIIVLNKEFQFDDKPFENDLFNQINISPEIFDYDPSGADGDFIGTSIEIYNSYCGLCRLFVNVKLIRYICANGVIMGEKIGNIIVKHNTNEVKVDNILRAEIPKAMENVEKIYMEYLPKFKKEISLADAIKLLEKAQKLGVSSRYIKKVKEEVFDKLEKVTNMVKLWVVWNFITYNIERNKTIMNMATKQYNVYRALMNEVKNI